MESQESTPSKPNFLSNGTEQPKRDDLGRFSPKEEKVDVIRDEPDLFPLKKYFGIESGDPVEDSRLQSIMDELRDQGIREPGDILTKLKELEIRLGRDDFENRPSKILTYLRLSRDVTDKIKQIKAMEWGNA